MNSRLLKARMVEHGYTQAALAKKIGIAFSTFNSKVNETHGTEFHIGEVNALRRALGLTMDEVEKIFFD